MAQGIAEILGQIRGGYALNDAALLMDDLVKAVKATGKAGTLTIKLKVEPDKSDDRIVNIKPDIDVKTPKRGYSPGIFFVDDRGKLVRDDPKQTSMFEERAQQGVATIGQGAPRVPPPPTETAAERESTEAPRADEANIQRLGLGRSA